MKNLILILFTPFILFSQDNFPINGVRETNQIIYAFINADIYTDYNSIINNATLVIKEDKILKIGNDIKIPQGSKIIDLQGYKICPSFIDIYTDYGQDANSVKIELSSWNPALKSEFNAINNYIINKEKATHFINNGFGLVNSLRKDGIIRGTSALVFLSYDKPHQNILLDKASLCFSFDKGTSSHPYPKSLMGSIAILRQTYYDLDWYQRQNGTFNNSLKSLNEAKYLPKIFEVNDCQSIFRSQKIAKEFQEKFIIRTNGDEYQRVNEIKNMKLPLIVPINFPKLKISNNPYNNINISLAELKHADTAPFNLSILIENGIDCAITTDGIDDWSHFRENISTIKKTGVSNNEILKSLTYNPAKFLNIYSDVGSIEQGKKANFLIYSGDLFNDNFCLHQNWINGKCSNINDMSIAKLQGNYEFIINNNLVDTVSLYISDNKLKIKIKNDTSSYNRINQFKVISSNISFSQKNIFFSGSFYNDIIEGEFYDSLGIWGSWELIKLNASNLFSLKSELKPNEDTIHSKVVFPNMAYGLSNQPITESVLFKNATIWTNELEGIIDSCDLAIENGKIIGVGRNLNIGIFKSNKDVKVVDATNKHITSGIIDEHSHIAISKGVNEGTHAITSEVRVGDVINANDINIYRQLAGGVTIAQLLHGSANPIGGQSAIIKLRWGQHAENLKYNNAKPFIKFALGENVKQSNWGSNYNTRFPQTRMGVEQIIIDAFVQAQEYQIYKKEYKKRNIKKIEFRTDLKLEPLVEVLNNERFVTCHSYIQSEILMLMEIANKFNFKINTFTHILEGYKVAKELKLHGASASTFSDWWAYKYEVNDAIPYNATLLSKYGVNTAINSDDAEMGRRLNQEAAKMIKYGNSTQEEAWKAITLNPAKMLRIDQYVGSIKINKDADIVLWSSNPLSMYTNVEATYIDGRCYFSLEQDSIHRQIIKNERAFLLNKLLKKTK